MNPFNPVIKILLLSLASTALAWVAINTIFALPVLLEYILRLSSKTKTITGYSFIFFIFVMYFSLRHLTNTSATKRSAWIPRENRVPDGDTLINAQYRDGSIRWNKMASDLNWEANTINPIVQWMKKTQHKAKSNQDNLT